MNACSLTNAIHTFKTSHIYLIYSHSTLWVSLVLYSFCVSHSFRYSDYYLSNASATNYTEPKGTHEPNMQYYRFLFHSAFDMESLTSRLLFTFRIVKRSALYLLFCSPTSSHANVCCFHSFSFDCRCAPIIYADRTCIHSLTHIHISKFIQWLNLCGRCIEHPNTHTHTCTYSFGKRYRMQ